MCSWPFPSDILPVASRPSGAGAIVGGVVGKQFGSGTGRALTTIGGAACGAAAGNAVELRTRRDDEVFRVTVRFEDGSVCTTSTTSGSTTWASATA